MNSEKYLQYYTEDFILDEFMQWVLKPNKKNNVVWSAFLEQNPQKKKQAEDVAFIIKTGQPVESEVPQIRLNEILHEIEYSSLRHNKIDYRILKYAAIIAILVSLGGALFF